MCMCTGVYIFFYPNISTKSKKNWPYITKNYGFKKRNKYLWNTAVSIMLALFWIIHALCTENMSALTECTLTADSGCSLDFVNPR